MCYCHFHKLGQILLLLKFYLFGRLGPKLIITFYLKINFIRATQPDFQMLKNKNYFQPHINSSYRNDQQSKWRQIITLRNYQEKKTIETSTYFQSKIKKIKFFYRPAHFCTISAYLGLPVPQWKTQIILFIDFYVLS